MIGRSSVRVALVAALLVAPTACGRRTPPEPLPETGAEPTRGESTGQSAEGSEGTGLAAPEVPLPDPPLEFAEPTERQMELHGIAVQSLDRNDVDTAIASLISLSETSEYSAVRAAGTLLLSEIYHERGDGQRALDLLLMLRRTAPPMGELEFLLGRSWIESGQLADAEDALRRAIRVNPAFLRSYVSLGALLAEAGRSADAEEVWVGFERQVLRMGEILSGDAPDLDKLSVIQGLRIELPDSRVTRALLRALESTSRDVRGSAIATLAHVGTSEAIEPLQALLRDARDPEIAAVATEAIRAIESRPTTPDGSGSGAPQP